MCVIDIPTSKVNFSRKSYKKACTMLKQKRSAVKKGVSKPAHNKNTPAPLFEPGVPDKKTAAGNQPSSSFRFTGENRWRVSRQQLELLASAMEASPSLALSLAKCREDREEAHQKWDRIAAMLNKTGGVDKTARGWLRYWTDMKFKVRRKHAYISSHPEGGSLVKLTSFERRLVKILTDGDGNLLFSTAAAPAPKELNPLPDDDPEVTEIKSETDECNETSSAAIPSETDERINSPAIPISPEETISIDQKKITQLKIENLQLEMQRRKEIHELEKSHLIEKHKIEMEILHFKKRKLIREFDTQFNRDSNREPNRDCNSEKVDCIHIIQVNGSELTGEAKFSMRLCNSCSKLNNLGSRFGGSKSISGMCLA